jgi:hypothetical protein
MEIILITAPAPEEVIPDRENDRLFMDMVERGDNGEFGLTNTEPVTDEEIAEIARTFPNSYEWNGWIFRFPS